MTFTPQNTHTRSVTLTADEIECACAFAKRIEDANRRNRRRDKQGLRVPKQKSLEMRESGFCGEAALAKALGYTQNVLADAWRSRPDVGIYDVMTTKYTSGSLIFTPRDRLMMQKVLVIDESPQFHICGWYLCDDARAHETYDRARDRNVKTFWRIERDGGGAFYVPQHLLKPIPELQARQTA